MKEVELTNLKSELDLIKDERLVYVLIWNEYCNACKPMMEYLDSVADEFPEYVFLSTHVEEPPLFAPGVIPASMIFFQSVRMFEGYGYTGESNTKLSLVLWREQWKERITGLRRNIQVPKELENVVGEIKPMGLPPEPVTITHVETEPLGIQHID
jgi:thiol-disulfide isomerase/thioredoxin